jgi:3-methyladenine DNA glycosylase AlkD
MHPWLQPLVNKYESERDPDRALQMKKYMKNRFEFYGIPTPRRRALMKAHMQELGRPDWGERNMIAGDCWAMDEREWQSTLLDLMNRFKRNLSPEDLPLLESLITRKSWWDTVDGIAGWLLGELFRKHPEMILPATTKWMESGNVWLQRCCLLFQLKYKEETDLILLFGFIEALQEHESFWIRKAIGWILREYSKTDPAVVRAFVHSHPGLSGLSKREALKRIGSG